MPRERPSHARRDSSQTPSTWDKIIAPDRKIGLTRERIVAAAMAIADEKGLSAVSIRNLAVHLGSSPMALYHHIPNKQDLLNLMLDAAHGAFEWRPEEAATWREALTHLACEMRRSLKQHPWVTEIRAGDPEHGPQYMRIFEAVLARVEGLGLEARTAARVVWALYVLASGFGATGTGGGLPRMSKRVLENGDFPRLLTLVEAKPKLSGDEMFLLAVRWLLEGVAADLHQVSDSADSARG